MAVFHFVMENWDNILHVVPSYSDLPGPGLSMNGNGTIWEAKFEQHYQVQKILLWKLVAEPAVW